MKTNLSRRSFMGGILSIAAVTSIPIVRSMPILPIIYGDGIGDDTAGLQALLNNLPVDIRADAARIMKGEFPIVRNGTFKISRGLILEFGRLAEFHGCLFSTTKPFDEPIFNVSTNSVLDFKGNTIKLAPGLWKGGSLLQATAYGHIDIGETSFVGAVEDSTGTFFRDF